MSSVLRFSPSRLGLAYIALGVLALALFAIPLWFAWQTNLSTFKVYVWYGIAAAMAIVLLLEVTIGWLIRRALLAEVQEISRTASAIATGDLSRRLETRGGSPALDALARTVNDMLAQLASQNVQLESEVGVRRQAQQALQGARDELEEVVAQRTAELARANEALRLSEERYARAMEAAEEGHWELNLATDEMFLSERTKMMLGFTRDERFASRAEFFARQPIHPDDRQRVTDARDAVRSGKTARYEVEYRVLPRPGEVRWLRSRGKLFPEEGGAPARISGSLTDITEQKHAEGALRLSEERYARAMEASDAGHWDWNVLAGEMFQSARMKQLLGFPVDTQFTGRDDWMARIPFHPDDRRRVEDAIAATLAGTSDRYDVDYRIVLQSRETRWVRARGRVYRDEQGRAIRVAGSLFDITEAKAAEDELRLRKEDLQRLMESVSDYLWSAEVAADGSYSYRYYSPVVERITGWPREHLLESRERWVELLHPLDRPWVDEAFRRLISGATEQVDVEYRIVRPDGTLRWVRDSAHGARVEDGRILLYGVVGDITERKLGAEALRDSEARFRALAESALAGIYLIQENRFRYVNPAMARMFGYTPEELVDRLGPDDLVHPDDRTLVAENIRRRVEGEVDEIRYDFRGVRRDGSVFPVEVHGRRIEFGGKPGVMGALVDNTERKRAVDELRESEARFRGLTELSSDWYWEQDENLRFTYLSNQAAQLTGYSSQSSLGKTRWEIENMEPLSCSWAEHQALLAARQPFRDLECRRIGSDGTVRYLSMSGAPIFDAQGRFKGYRGIGRNITERKRAEEQLRESEALKSAMFETALDCIISIDHDGRVIEFNPAAERTFGCRRAEAMGKELAELIIPPRLREQHRRGLARYLATGEGPVLGTRIEMAAVRADGAEFPVELSVTRIPAEGAPLFTVYLRDITERKRIEEALRLSEARYARAMDASADGLWEWNPATDELFTSPRARELWGVPDGVEIRTRAELKTQDLQFTEDTIRECIAQPSGVEMTYSVLNQAGELRWVRCVGKVFLGEHGEPMLVTGSLTDVTERKLAADALRQSEEELRARQDMLDLAQKAARAVAFEWHIGAGEGENRWSPDLEIMYGLEPGSYDGTYETWKKLVFPADWPAVKEAIKRANETGDIAAEYRVVQPDGAVRWLQAKGRMFFDDERKPTRMVGFMLDVTDRHQAEEELRRLERQLRQAQRLEAMGTLAGGIAHDFNNILGAILGYGEMALRDAPKGSRLRRDVDSIITAGERGRALVERILAFSRSGVGERVAVHVEKIVDEALDLLAASLPEGVAVEGRLRAGRAAVLGDPTQVHQVLMNLATNALQAMPSGGTLRVALEVLRRDAPRVATVGTLAAGEYVVLEVADSGTGIPPEILERIFDPFFTTKEVGVGTGLGLSLVHGIVSELGGAIDVASTVGEGSVFSVYLPRAGEAASDRERDEVDAPRGNRQQVLIVDDEAPLVTLATETLAELGYVPSGYTSSTAALAAFCADPARFDAVITDERMPGMSGSALIREIRKVRRTIPILLVSGYAGSAVMQRALQSGADEVLKKPLSARELATSLARVLRA